jgi:cytochrome c oxidase subunit 1
VKLPRIRSERAAFDAAFPHLAPWGNEVKEEQQPTINA